MSERSATTVRRRLVAILHRAAKWGRDKVPPGARSALGVVLVIGGVFGFLPILGYWMIPAGGVLIALDVPPLRRRLMAWLERERNKRSERHKRGEA